MRFRTAFPVALILGGAIGGTLAAGGIDPHPARAGQPMGLISEATAATAARWDIPVVRNESVEHFVELFTGRRSALMADYLKRSGRYEGMIRQKLRKAGMPEDLVYLSMIESGFNPNARSHASAVGLWQFMAPTARGYGLRVDGYVDERRDPEKSTDAALRYLRDLHTELGSWYLAAAAYNGGGGRVGRALKAETGRVRGKNDADFWRIRHRLPRETREYVPLMVAAALIGKEPEKYGLGGVSRWMPVETDTVTVPGGIDLGVVARAAGVSEREVTRLNSHLVQKMTPPGKKPFPVSIPEGSAERFAAAFPALREEALARAEARRAEAAEGRHFDIALHHASVEGLVHVQGTLDVADALALDAAIAARAHGLLDEHPDLPLDVRRAMAAGTLADTATGAGSRNLDIYVHLDADGVEGLARVENTRSLVTVEQVAEWCQVAGTPVVIRPVLDLNANLHTDGYRPTVLQREQAVLIHPTCVFPRCTRPARSCDIDHVIPYAEGGQTETDNLAPLCRRHHRLKTHTPWHQAKLGATFFEWTSPHGLRHTS
ncbi:MAG: transglycosylase SLT domain-containing protein [Longimicrobiaceae bacterium]